MPDYWLAHGNPWEFPRPEICFRVRYGGTWSRKACVLWVGTDDVLANAYDTIIPGYGTEVTNTLRLWSAKATEEIDLSAFNQGNYFGAVEEQEPLGERVPRAVSGRLHPGRPRAASASGVLLRLGQPAGHPAPLPGGHGDFDALPDKVSIHLNDTHPVLAVPELMRLLVNEHGVGGSRPGRCAGGCSPTPTTP